MLQRMRDLKYLIYYNVTFNNLGTNYKFRYNRIVEIDFETGQLFFLKNSIYKVVGHIRHI